MHHRPPHASVCDIALRLRSGGISAAGVATRFLSCAAAADRHVGAFLTLSAGRARSDAQRADQDLSKGMRRSAIHGVPYALKDNFDTEAIRTSCHSRLRWSDVPLRDSAVAARLRTAGAVLMGKLNMDEFGLSGSSPDLPRPPARNPWNVEHITGGSSSGCAAAVAAGLVPIAIGSDTAGSIRAPAAYCGVVGVKPTFGLVSRRGLFPLSPTLDHCGVVTRTVRDAAHVLAAIAGHDPEDLASADVAACDYAAEIDRGVRGLRIGVLWDFFTGSTDQAAVLQTRLAKIARGLADGGAQVCDVAADRLPEYGMFRSCGAIIMLSEACAVHAANLRARPADYSRMTLRRLALGATISRSDTLCAMSCRRELTAAIEALLTDFDVLIAPTILSGAPRLSAPAVDFPRSPIRAVPFNVTGHPAITVPVGLNAEGMPLALQAAARRFDEAAMFRVAHAIEALSDWPAVAMPAYGPCLDAAIDEPRASMGA